MLFLFLFNYNAMQEYFISAELEQKKSLHYIRALRQIIIKSGSIKLQGVSTWVLGTWVPRYNCTIEGKTVTDCEFKIE